MENKNNKSTMSSDTQKSNKSANPQSDQQMSNRNSANIKTSQPLGQSGKSSYGASGGSRRT